MRSDRVREYVEIVERTGMAGYRKTPGNVDAQIVTRDLGDGRTELLTFSWWEGLDRIRAFAGDDIETAKYYPRTTSSSSTGRPRSLISRSSSRLTTPESADRRAIAKEDRAVAKPALVHQLEADPTDVCQRSLAGSDEDGHEEELEVVDQSGSDRLTC